jgi:hypothetical protein
MKAFLVSAWILLALIPLEASKNLRISIRLEGAGHSLTDSYEKDLWMEKSTYRGNLESAFFIHTGIQLGLKVARRITLQVGYTYGRKQMKGTFSLQVPNPWFNNKPRLLSWKNDTLEYENHIIDFGFRYDFLNKKRINLFFYGGVSYYLINFPTYSSSDLFWKFPDHLTIDQVEYEEYIPRVLGIKIGLGCSISIFEFSELEIGIIYRRANASIPVRINTAEEYQLEFNPGGIFPVISLNFIL